MKPCGKLKVPEVPDIDPSKLPAGMKFPESAPSLDDIKAKAKPPSFGDALKNAASGIAGNIKDTISAFNPLTIASKVAEGVGNMIGEIGDAVTGALDGLGSLKDKIQNFDPGKIVEGPANAFKDIEGKLDSAAESAKEKLAQFKEDCGKKSVSEAGQVSGKLKDKAKAAAKDIPGKDKVKMAKDPEFKAAKQSEIEQQVSTETADELEQQIIDEGDSTLEIEEQVQESTHSNNVTVGAPVSEVTCDTKHTHNMLIIAESWVSMMYYYQSITDDANTRFFTVDEDPGIVGASMFKALELASMLKAYAAMMLSLVRYHEKICPDMKITPDAMFDNTVSIKTHLETNLERFQHSHAKLNGPGANKNIWIEQQQYQDMFFRLFSDPEGFLKQHITMAGDLTKTTTAEPFTFEQGFWVRYTGGSKRFANTPQEINFMNQNPLQSFKDALAWDEVVRTGGMLHVASTNMYNHLGRQYSGQEITGTADRVTALKAIAEHQQYNGRIRSYPQVFIFSLIMPAGGNEMRMPFPNRLTYAAFTSSDYSKIERVSYIGTDPHLAEVWGDGFKL